MRLVIFILVFLFFSSCSLNNHLNNKKTEIKKEQNSVVINNENAVIAKEVVDIKKDVSVKKDFKQKEYYKKSKIASDIKFKRIAFIGDSHIASDYMPNYFRNSLNIHSLGFIPAILPKWHNQYLISYNSKNLRADYLINTKSNLSFSGINAVCVNNCNIDLNLKFLAKKIEYLEFKNNLWSIKKYADNVENIKFNVENNGIIGGFISNNLSFIDSLGINGASVFNYDRINEKIQKIVAKKLNYDLVILSFGTNESVSKSIDSDAFINKFNNIIKIFKNNNTKIVILIPPEPVIYENGSYVKGYNNKLVKELLIKIAKQTNSYIFDIDKLMQSEGGKQEWIKQNKSLKNTHLTKQGYDYVALKLLKYLEKI